MPLGNAARATRAVSAGTGPSDWGWSDTGDLRRRTERGQILGLGLRVERRDRDPPAVPGPDSHAGVARQPGIETAGVDIDGARLGTVVRDGVPRPFLFLLSDHHRETDSESRRILATIQGIYDRLPPGGRGLVTLPGADHFLFSDDGALLKSHLVQHVLRAVGVLGMDGRRQLAATATAVRRFLDAHVGGTHAPM